MYDATHAVKAHLDRHVTAIIDITTRNATFTIALNWTQSLSVPGAREMHREADKVVQGKDGAEEQVQVRPPGKRLWRAIR